MRRTTLRCRARTGGDKERERKGPLEIFWDTGIGNEKTSTDLGGDKRF